MKSKKVTTVLNSSFEINSESIKQFIIDGKDNRRISLRRINLVKGIIAIEKNRQELFRHPIIIDKDNNVIDGRCRMKALQAYIQQHPNERIEIMIGVQGVTK